MTDKPQMHIGTSGWSYKHWKGLFYPEKIHNSDMLFHYAKTFGTVEINSAFYGMPSKHTLQKWHQSVPDHFLFSVKASRYITHQKKLSDPKPGLKKFFGRIQYLGDKLGPVLFQLPPHWHKNLDRISTFIKALPRDHRYVFEFRDKSWFDSDIINVLKHTNTALCIYDLEGYESPICSTTDFVYIRLHGPGAAYQGEYSSGLLTKWGNRFKNWLRDGKNIYCYFNNDFEGHAPQDATVLLSLLKNMQIR